jgi:DNA polymerase II
VTDAFVLTRGYRDTRDGLLLEYWLSSDAGPLRVHVTDQRPLFFVERAQATRNGQRRPLALCAPSGAPVDGVYFRTQRELRDERERLQASGLLPYEADVSPAERYLMERFITAGCSFQAPLAPRRGFAELRDPELRPAAYQPKLRCVSLDIETDGFEGALLSIALLGDAFQRVFMLGGGEGKGEAPLHTRVYRSEAELIAAFCASLRELDPDVILGWNVIEFDFDYLCRRASELGVPLALGRDGSEAQLTAGSPPRVRMAGRVVLDGITSLRAASYQLESFALEDVAQHFLGRGKLIDHPHGDRGAQVRELYQRDRAALARYNLEDCRLVCDIFARTDLLGYLIERAHSTGLALDRPRGSVAAFDNLYLPRLHRAGYVAPSVGAASDLRGSPGGYVLQSAPGLYGNVIVLDFKSLYPSIIRTFGVDPLALWAARGDCPAEEAVPGFEGARFHRTRHILPDLIRTLWRTRDEAKARGDAARSHAIKILMNSFYGVLGTPGCRFFDPRLASSITLRGHEIITRSRDLLQARGLSVIYGDTDSLFVVADPQLSAAECQRLGGLLADELSAYWREAVAAQHRLESCLEVEFDTHYSRFYMPTLRDSEQGSKKRYAGLVRGPDGDRVEFTGLEAVRSDWTPLARRFQRELFRRVFLGEPFEDYVRDLAEALLRGRHDAELVYRKRVRRELDQYVKNVPPHVRAARHLADPGRVISYCMTVHGPQPAQALCSALDYAHYLTRQLAPAADGILQHCGTSFARLTERQLSLF